MYNFFDLKFKIKLLILNLKLSANMMPLTSEDYFNQFTYNQVTNMMMNNTNQNQNHLSNSNFRITSLKYSP